MGLALYTANPFTVPAPSPGPKHPARPLLCRVGHPRINAQDRYPAFGAAAIGFTETEEGIGGNFFRMRAASHLAVSETPNGAFPEKYIYKENSAFLVYLLYQSNRL